MVESESCRDRKLQQKRIEVSIEPELANANLEKEDLVPGNIVLCSVKSIEDHGLILDCGIEGFSAFVSNKELKMLKSISKLVKKDLC